MASRRGLALDFCLEKRIGCPTESPPKKVACPKCEQRLQIPSPAARPARNKTALGALLPPGGQTLMVKEACERPWCVGDKPALVAPDWYWTRLGGERG